MERGAILFSTMFSALSMQGRREKDMDTNLEEQSFRGWLMCVHASSKGECVAALDLL